MSSQTHSWSAASTNHVVPVGVVIGLLGTYPFTQAGVDTSYIWLSVALLVRGIGLGR